MLVHEFHQPPTGASDVLTAGEGLARITVRYLQALMFASRWQVERHGRESQWYEKQTDPTQNRP